MRSKCLTNGSLKLKDQLAKTEKETHSLKLENPLSKAEKAAR
jgi:hypothetical protein